MSVLLRTLPLCRHSYEDSENRGYMADEETVIIECQKCGREVGRMGKFQGKDFLIVNGIVTTYWRGVCAECGKEFHWDVGTKALAELINQKRQKE